jgi:hypothetical protein
VNQFVEALADAFPDLGPFRAMLRHRVGKLISRDALQEENPSNMARKVVERANEDGWAGPLLNAAREARPGHPRIYELACDYGLAAVKPEDDRRIRDALPGLDIAAWRSRVGQLEGRVGCLRCPDGTSGTGFLVGPDLFLTSPAVLTPGSRGRGSARQVTVSFDRKRLDNGAVLKPGLCVSLAEDSIVAIHDVHDPDLPRYALLRLDHAAAERAVGWPNVEPGAEARGWIRQYRPVAPAPAAWIVLYSAAGGSIGLAYAASRGAFSSAGIARVRYPLAGLLGGAGAPVFDEAMNLIGMHESRLGASEAGGASEGIPLAAILEHLSSQGVRLEVESGTSSLAGNPAGSAHLPASGPSLAGRG